MGLEGLHRRNSAHDCLPDFLARFLNITWCQEEQPYVVTQNFSGFNYFLSITLVYIFNTVFLKIVS